jgi:hypothetical protein
MSGLLWRFALLGIAFLLAFDLARNAFLLYAQPSSQPDGYNLRRAAFARIRYGVCMFIIEGKIMQLMTASNRTQPLGIRRFFGLTATLASLSWKYSCCNCKGQEWQNQQPNQ